VAILNTLLLMKLTERSQGLQQFCLQMILTIALLDEAEDDQLEYANDLRRQVGEVVRKETAQMRVTNKRARVKPHGQPVSIHRPESPLQQRDLCGSQWCGFLLTHSINVSNCVCQSQKH